MRLKRTDRGFKCGEFKDINGDQCSIQESSLASKSALWLGADRGTHYDNAGAVTRNTDGTCAARMHIDKPLARELIKHLQRFVDTGGL